MCLKSIILLEKNNKKIIKTSNIIFPSPKKSVSPSEKVAPSEKVEKGSGTLYDTKYPVVTIHQKNLDNKIEKENTKKYQLYGQSTILTHCFHLGHEWLEEKVSTREPDSYKCFYKLNTEGQGMEAYEIFVFPVGNTNIK